MTVEVCVIGGGCFWGVGKYMRRHSTIKNTWVGYAGGATVRPDYESVCTGKAGHAEVVKF